MKITINLEIDTKYHRTGFTEKYRWSIRTPRAYSTSSLPVTGYQYTFERALEEAREAATDIYRFNEKKRKFPYVEEFDPSEVNDD